jgi:tetratricopeptide (TPR) repeat protein
MAGIFISLTTEDAELAKALETALIALLGESVPVCYSPSDRAGRAPKGGSNWFDWIVEQVTNCDFCFVLLTPNSLQKPWILWEAGAVYSAATASGGKSDKVRPLLFQVKEEQLPSPFRQAPMLYQRGDDPRDIRKVFNEIVAEFNARPDPVFRQRLLEGMDRLEPTIADYMANVHAFLLRAAMTPTSVAIQEWLGRLEALVSQNRRSEVAFLQDWMEIAFGRVEPEDRARPIDLRLHSRLAEAYLKNQGYERAVQQLELGRQIAPRDIFILRTLGRALLDKNDTYAAEKVIARIRELHASSFEHNVECAALLARLHRAKGDPDRARIVLEEAHKNNKDSYYLANVAGEVCLELRNVEQARKWFQTALDIVVKLREENVWVYATAANAEFVLGHDAKAAEYVTKIAGKKPDEDSLNSIIRGLNGLAQHIGGEGRLGDLLDILLPERVATRQHTQADARA